MRGVTPWVERAEAPRVRTGGWRTAGSRSPTSTRCVNCLLCWLYCPDSAVRARRTTFVGFDLDVCKGCAICVEICPAEAIRMVAE